MPDSALDLLFALTLESGQRWGEVAAHFQLSDAVAVLGGEPPYNYITRSRGGSKTADLAGLSIVAMLSQLPSGSRLYACASDRDQGSLIIQSIQGFAARTPELRNALQIDAFRVTATRTNSVLDVLAADAASAFGLRPSWVVIDELSQWGTTDGPRRLFEAVSSSAAKSSTCRMAIITSAGSPSHWSFKVLQHAKEDPLWRVAETAGPPPWLSPERLAEQRRRLPESSYARLFLNQWTESEDKLTNIDDLRACTVLEGPLAPQEGKRYVVSLDVGLKHDRTVMCVCHGEPIVGTLDGNEHAVGTRIFLDRLEVREGSRAAPVQLADIEELVSQAATAYNNAPVVLDPWQAVGLAQRLRARRVRVEEFNFSAQSVGRLATTLHLLLRNRALAIPDDQELIDELASVRLKETSPGVLRMDHDADAYDDRAVSLALAAHRLLEEGSKPRGFGTPKVVRYPGRRGVDEDWVDPRWG